MKTIGLLGGMSWESTLTYYTQINRAVQARLGGLHSARIVLHSVDFDPIEKLQHAGDWLGAARILSQAAQSIEAGGADFFLICTNTMHKVAEPVQAAVSIPLVHIADATADVLQKKGINRVGLLGTAYTMEQDFYRGRLEEKFGLEVVVPDAADRQAVHAVIFKELCLGRIEAESRERFHQIVARLGQMGAEGVILGCTEIGLLVQQKETDMPLFDTARIHARAAVDRALVESG